MHPSRDVCPHETWFKGKQYALMGQCQHLGYDLEPCQKVEIGGMEHWRYSVHLSHSRLWVCRKLLDPHAETHQRCTDGRRTETQWDTIGLCYVTGKKRKEKVTGNEVQNYNVPLNNYNPVIG